MLQNDMISAIYETLLGERSDPVIGVENAFADGSYCESCYTEMCKAYERVCFRLGKRDEDADLDQIITSMDAICADLCRQMFLLGIRFGSASDKIPDNDSLFPQ